MREVSVFVMLMFFSFPALSQIYKWTDANGKVHYSDKGVGNGEAIKVSKPPPADPQAKIRIEQYKNQLDGSRQLKEEKAEEEQKRLAETQEKCAKIHDRLQGFEKYGQVYQMKDGERFYLDHKQKDQQMDEMKQFLKKNCE